jgi:hypothetical protein
LFHHPVPSGGKAMSSSKVFAVGKELFIVFALKWDPADRRKKLDALHNFSHGIIPRIV